MRERREEERKIVREGEAISPSRDEERRRKRERGEEEREKRGEKRKISPSSCYARARAGEQGGEETSRERPCSPSRERPSLRGREEREERERGRERERIKRERMKTWTKRGSHMGDGIRKPSTSAGMKGRATIRCLPYLNPVYSKDNGVIPSLSLSSYLVYFWNIEISKTSLSRLHISFTERFLLIFKRIISLKDKLH